MSVCECRGVNPDLEGAGGGGGNSALHQMKKHCKNVEFKDIV